MEILVSRHHEEQRRIARETVAALDPVWRILDFRDLRGTTAPWLKAARPIVERGFLYSRYAAAEFVKHYRNANLSSPEPLNTGVPAPWEADPPREVSVKIMVSLKVTGPLWVANNTTKGMTDLQVQEVLRSGFSKSSGAATRLVLNGGRGTVRDLVNKDPRARGVAGIAGEDSCDSCRLLTSPIWKWEGQRKMNAVAVGHDFCTCSAKPVY